MKLLRLIVTAIVSIAAIAAATGVAVTSEEQGEGLSHRYCGTCHLRPIPEHLDKSTWIAKVFPVMRRFMGMDSLAHREQMTHDLAAMFPTIPMMTEDEWFTVASWYVDHAPSSMPDADQVNVLGESRLFECIKVPVEQETPMTSLVQFDTVQKMIVIGDALTNKLRVFDLSLHLVDEVDVGGPPSSLVIRGATWYVSNMGKLLPHDSAIGSVLSITWKTRPGVRGERPIVSKVLDSLRRPTHLLISDLNSDGREDILVAEYGNVLGQYGWYEQRAKGSYVYHQLAAQPGAIRSVIKDINGDKRPDIVVLMAQAREVVRAYINNGRAKFTSVNLIESPPCYGSSSFAFQDVNHDGIDEIIVTTGDNGDYEKPPFKPYHGVYVYSRVKPLSYKQTSFLQLDGAYGAYYRDFNNDKSIDLLAFSYFPRLTRGTIDIIRLYENVLDNGKGLWTIPCAGEGRWLVSDMADIDADGDLDVILGNVSLGPSAVSEQQAERWRLSGYQALLLRNTTR